MFALTQLSQPLAETFGLLNRAGQPTVYHIMSRTALDGFPLQDTEKDQLMASIAKLCKVYLADLLGFCLMGNHFHLVIRMHPSDSISNEEISRRYKLLYGQESTIIPCQVDEFRDRISNLGALIKDIKQGFSKRIVASENQPSNWCRIS